jgi:hypothetical protein
MFIPIKKDVQGNITVRQEIVLSKLLYVFCIFYLFILLAFKLKPMKNGARGSSHIIIFM